MPCKGIKGDASFEEMSSGFHVFSRKDSLYFTKTLTDAHACIMQQLASLKPSVPNDQRKSKIMNGNWYFTAPWDPVPIRRADALGFRVCADHFADLLAPGLSNGTSDARWISILSWCLQWSDVAWRKAGGGDLSTRDGQRARYAWLRPLELLWVARTLESGQTTGQLRGKRSVQRWREGDRKAPDFAMSADQFRRYRQSGTYGAYRVALRTMPGFTTGDGWTLGDTAKKLAEIVNKSLSKEVRLEFGQFDNTRWGCWAGDSESRYWIEKGWINWQKSPKEFLVTRNEDILKQLPREERNLLNATVFAKDSVRLKTAKILADAKTARTHAEICDALAADALAAKPQTSLAFLPAFTRLADASMDAMRALWRQINQDANSQTSTIETIAKSMDGSSLRQLRETGAAWLKLNKRSDFPHERVVTALAESLAKAKAPADQIRALSQHHGEFGGGRRWFRMQDDKLIPLVANNDIAASNYRFRLLPLVRLAAQCGVADMKKAYEAAGQMNSGDEEVDDE